MINVGWTARDGFLDLFPMLASQLGKLDQEIVSHYVCHHPLEKEYLNSRFKLNDISVISTFLKKNWSLFDCTHEHIKYIENKFNTIPLIRCLWSDKFQLKLPMQTMARNLVGHFEFWEKFLVDKNIDVLICERPSILNTCIAWLVCRKLNIRFMSLIDIPVLHERISVSTSWEGHFDQFEEFFKEKNIDVNSKYYQSAIDYVKKMQINPQKTSEAQVNMELAKKNSGLPLKEVKKLIFEPAAVFRRNNSRKEYYINGSIWKMFFDWATIYVNSRLYSLLNIFDHADTDRMQPFFLFPLHRYGEWSNYSFMGPAFADQASTVKLVSDCLPVNTYLYVKEHTGGFGEKSIKFYRKVKKLQNVRLIHPYADTFDLIRKCRAVITLGSTMGFEAIMMKKAAILLGNPWYRNLPGVYKAESPEILSELLQNCDRLSLPSEDETVKMVYSLFDISFDGVGASQPKTLDPENIQRLSEILYCKIKEAKS